MFIHHPLSHLELLRRSYAGRGVGRSVVNGRRLLLDVPDPHLPPPASRFRNPKAPTPTQRVLNSPTRPETRVQRRLFLESV